MSPRFDFDKFGIRDEHIHEFFGLMQHHRVVVAVGPLGSGRSTLLPYRLMKPPEPLPSNLFTVNGQIIVTQPRIAAVHNIPPFVARELHDSDVGPGFDIGFHTSQEKAYDAHNKLIFMTEGILLNMLASNELASISVIMIDEAHERSLNTDLILGLLKDQIDLYPDIKVILASSTTDVNLFVDYFGGSENVPTYTFPGRHSYSEEIRFRQEHPIPTEQMPSRMPQEMAKKVIEILRNIESGNEKIVGHILGFLQGERAIKQAIDLILEGLESNPELENNVDVLPLYAALPQEQQDKALSYRGDHRKTRVIIATNVAEISLTVDGVSHVIDSGLINKSIWDPYTQTNSVETICNSQAGCKRRWSKSVRIGSGIAHCLYTEDQYEQFSPNDSFMAEITRTPLEWVILRAKQAGVDDITQFDWIQRPSTVELDRAARFLQQIGAIDSENDLTEHGLRLLKVGQAEINDANLMILADHFGCAIEMATVIAMRKLNGYHKLLIWENSWDESTRNYVHQVHRSLMRPCQDDLEFYLKLWSLWQNDFASNAGKAREAWSQEYFINHQVLQSEIESSRRALLDFTSYYRKDNYIRPIDMRLQTRLRIILTYAQTNNIYQIDQKNLNIGRAEGSYHELYSSSLRNPQFRTIPLEIGRGSICYNEILDTFVCGTRNRLRRSDSREDVIATSFVARINPEWLNIIGQPLLLVARLIAANENARKVEL